MLGKTHLFYGLTASAAVMLALAHPLTPLPLAEGVAAGGVGALLPDLDEPGSMISNSPRILGNMTRRSLRHATHHTPLQLLGTLVGAFIILVAMLLNGISRALSAVVRAVAGGHREGSHWLPIWLALSIGIYVLTITLLGPFIAVGFCVGYFSHLASDGCTKSGIPLVPGRSARLHLLPRFLRIRTGSASETIFTFFYTITLVALLIAKHMARF